MPVDTRRREEEEERLENTIMSEFVGLRNLKCATAKLFFAGVEKQQIKKEKYTKLGNNLYITNFSQLRVCT